MGGVGGFALMIMQGTVQIGLPTGTELGKEKGNGCEKEKQWAFPPPFLIEFEF